MAKKGTGRFGSSFDEFLAQQGILEECEEAALKEILADQIELGMENPVKSKLETE